MLYGNTANGNANASALVPRDPEDGSELDFLRFAHEVDDGGLVVSGNEPADTRCWELGSGGFLRRWWWAFGGEVLRETNGRRRARGLPALEVGGVGGVGGGRGRG